MLCCLTDGTSPFYSFYQLPECHSFGQQRARKLCMEAAEHPVNPGVPRLEVQSPDYLL